MTSNAVGDGYVKKDAMGQVGSVERTVVGLDVQKTITIQQTYKFAGETVTEKREVPVDSAEAKLYLSSKKPTSRSEEENTLVKNSMSDLRRPLRRPSRFDPNPGGIAEGGSLMATSGNSTAAGGIAVSSAKQKAAEEPAKLNTIAKSRMDWTRHIDDEGLEKELDEYGKAKEGFLGRREFLHRVEGRVDQGRRAA